MATILTIFRIKNWFYYLGYFILGFTLFYKEFKFFNLFYFLSSFFASAFALAYAYSFNTIIDKKLKSKCFIYPLIACLFLSFFLPLTSFVYLITFLVITSLYSLPKIRLKGIPFVSLLINAIGFNLIFMMGYFSYSFTDLFFLFFILLFILNLIAQLIHEIHHFSQDKKQKIKNTAIFLGRKNCYIMIKILLIFLIFLSLIFFHYKFILIGSSTLILSFYFLFVITKKVIYKIRKEFRNYGIIVGIIYLLELIFR